MFILQVGTTPLWTVPVAVVSNQYMKAEMTTSLSEKYWAVIVGRKEVCGLRISALINILYAS